MNKEFRPVALVFGFIAMMVVVTFIAAGCGGVSIDPINGTTTHTNIKHYNVEGRDVTCILVTNSQGTATMSCDWGAR